MTTEKIRQVLKRYNSGTCSNEEREIIEWTFIHFNEDSLDLSQDTIDQMSEVIKEGIPGKAAY